MCAVTPMKRFVKKSVRGFHTTFTSSKNVQYRLESQGRNYQPH